MPLDPALEPVRVLMDQLKQPFTGRSAADVRASSALTAAPMPEELKVVVGSVSETVVSGAAGDLRARVYRPVGDGPFPTIVFFHGGGFVLCDLDTHDAPCRELCRQTTSVVVSVDYRLAPETQFPGPLEDAIASATYVSEQVAEFGGDANRIVLAGDSAGGNLAAAAAQALRDAGLPLAAQLLVYPAVDFREGTERYPSLVEHATDGVILTAADMDWFDQQYAPGADREDPRLSPLLGTLEGLPPTVVVGAEMDPLRDIGEAYADALEAAGVPVRRKVFPGMIHGFFNFGIVGPSVQAAVDETCLLLADTLAEARVG